MAILLGKKIKIFSLSANRPLAEEIAESIGVPLSSCDIMYKLMKQFEDIMSLSFSLLLNQLTII